MKMCPMNNWMIKKIRIVGLAASNVLLGWSGASATINYCENYIKLIDFLIDKNLLIISNSTINIMLMNNDIILIKFRTDDGYIL